MEREPKKLRDWRSPPETCEKLRNPAKSYRSGLTLAEKKLWDALRNRRLAGLRFRRQHAIDRFLVDFFCSQARLVVEVDGSIHEQQTQEDAIRQQHLEQLGMKVLRFSNDEVVGGLETVLVRIAQAANERLPLSEVGEGVGG